MVTKVFKYPTGATIPEDAVFLSTRIEQTIDQDLVWHYFLVEVEE